MTPRPGMGPQPTKKWSREVEQSKEGRRMRTRIRRPRRLLSLVLGLAMGLSATAAGAGTPTPVVTIPDRPKVCMMQDTVMAVPAIPLAHDGKTYYGCCEMCKAKIATEPARYTLARDPVSGAVVDKATAALLSVDGRVLYFESEVTRSGYRARLGRAP